MSRKRDYNDFTELDPGDEEIKRIFARRSRGFDPLHWWQNKGVCLEEQAVKNQKNLTEKKEAKLYNPFEGQPDSRQLSESVAAFLTRLPPRTTRISQHILWIWIANPYLVAPRSRGGRDREGPSLEGSRSEIFTEEGVKILSKLANLREMYERENPCMALAGITRKVNVHKEAIVQRLLHKAVEMKVTSGKWMIFAEPDEINEVWAVVATAVANNELGTAAKVAPDGDGRVRLICVYTKDFSDMQDVERVIIKLRDLGLVETRGRPLYYKCDAWTYLNLAADNPYGIKASLYSSADILKPKTTAKKKGFFYEQQVINDDWKKIDLE